MNENYLMINGKRVDLTEEQIKKLGLKVEKDYFKKDEFLSETYYFINSAGNILDTKDLSERIDKERYNVANYCTNEPLLQQRALHETLSRLLWRFSMQNDGDKIDWNNNTCDKYYIYLDKQVNKFNINANNYCSTQGIIYFYSKEIAEKAIQEIVIPFMDEHPEFVW